MKVQLKSGRVLKVQFVHSSHDFVTDNAVAGGLRQFVDNLARSLNRRVTMVDIADVKSDPMYQRGQDVTMFESISQGFAVCYHGDTYVKLVGRAIALARALANAYVANALTEDEAFEVLDYFPNEEDWLVDNLADAA